MRRVLILGGTAEATALARALAGHDVVTSLAGRTDTVPDIPGTVRVGGFGGPDGLTAYLQAEGIGAVIDATHPFAARISAAAEQACTRIGIPRLALVRPGWQRQPGDRWTEVDSTAKAAEALPAIGRRAFLTVGIQEIGAFSNVRGVWMLVRLLTKQDLPLLDYRVVTGRPPFGEDDEAALMRTHGIDVLVSKASGGSATYAKIAAARRLGLPVLMIRRPEPPAGDQATDVAAALTWLDRLWS